MPTSAASTRRSSSALPDRRKRSDPVFLNRDEVLAFHADQIRVSGGSPGLRDAGMLDSALALPATSYSGEFVHGDLYEMAAAYLFHLASNHPFVDGNKRVAAVAALTFLYLNGVDLDVATKDFETLVMNVARGKVEKSEIAVFLRKRGPRR